MYNPNLDTSININDMSMIVNDFTRDFNENLNVSSDSFDLSKDCEKFLDFLTEKDFDGSVIFVFEKTT